MIEQLRRAVEIFRANPAATCKINNEQTLWALEDRGLVCSVFPRDEKRFRECRPTSAGIMWCQLNPA